MSVLRFRGARLSLGRRVVLDALDFDVPQGAFVGVLGANGAGKTTLMRAALGLVRPSAGSIEVFGRAARRGEPAIGYMPQARAALADLRLSARSFVSAASCGVGWGLPLHTRAERRDVERVLGLVDAVAYAHRPVGSLSGGERQRLLLAQSLLGEPRMLLLDEPLASLDPSHQAATVALVGHLQRQLRLTVLFSAHELNPLLPALDQVLYLGAGRAALGTIDDVIQPDVLSRLYGARVDVIRAQGHVFVVTNGGAPGATQPRRQEPAHARL